MAVLEAEGLAALDRASSDRQTIFQPASPEPIA